MSTDTVSECRSTGNGSRITIMNEWAKYELCNFLKCVILRRHLHTHTTNCFYLSITLANAQTLFTFTNHLNTPECVCVCVCVYVWHLIYRQDRCHQYLVTHCYTYHQPTLSTYYPVVCCHPVANVLGIVPDIRKFNTSIQINRQFY